jgi:hypothetical protein
VEDINRGSIWSYGPRDQEDTQYRSRRESLTGVELSRERRYFIGSETYIPAITKLRQVARIIYISTEYTMLQLDIFGRVIDVGDREEQIRKSFS